jgi:hypothetical protein
MLRFNVLLAKNVNNNNNNREVDVYRSKIDLVDGIVIKSTSTPGDRVKNYASGNYASFVNN